jgi:phospholipid transport system transporter-binding protein
MPTQFKPVNELTFMSVVSVRADLSKALMNDDSDRFCLDLSEVTYCDSAGLALLIEARKLCLRANKMFEVTGLSSDMLSLAEFCGVQSILEPV